MAALLTGSVLDFLGSWHAQAPASLWILLISSFLFSVSAVLYVAIFIAAPAPRAPVDSETRYTTVAADGRRADAQLLPCWQDDYIAQRLKTLAPDAAARGAKLEIEPAEVFLSLVVPAFNEELRLGKMLEEATEFLEREYGRLPAVASPSPAPADGPKQRKPNGTSPAGTDTKHTPLQQQGWEVLVVSDGSRDKTSAVALEYAARYPGGSVRVIELARNRGKGGAVTHGMRHVRGQYAIFADADGASKFGDAAKLVQRAQQAADSRGRAVAVGSRTHLRASDAALVQRSALRTFLMHSFHLFLRLLTPPATSRIHDTQCGFKLFTRPALPDIIPNMHSEGWIFDVEMLMLAEAANIPIVEVPIAWQEVKGSKLNVLWDSLGMAWGLAILRAAWAVGVYQT